MHVGKFLCENLNWAGISIFELKLTRLRPKPDNERFCILHVSNTNCANIISNIENVGYRVGYNELVWNLLLGANDD